MKVYFRQFYITPGVEFPFTFDFTDYLAGEMSALTVPSPQFCNKFGIDWKIIFNISAKREIDISELRGPARYKKDKDVEFSIFLPFDAIMRTSTPIQRAVESLIDGVCEIFERYQISTADIINQKQRIVEKVCSDPAMIEAAGD